MSNLGEGQYTGESTHEVNDSDSDSDSEHDGSGAYATADAGKAATLNGWLS